MKRLAYIWSMSIIAMTMAFAATAEEDKKSEEEYELPAVNVVSTPIVQSTTTDRYGQEKTVVEDEQIEDLNAGDISSALRRTPGVNISRYNLVGGFGGGDGGAIYIRGMGSGRPGAELSIMFDGVYKANSVWTHPLLDTISTDAASSIEVYKSPQPVFVGNMSFGAINVVPKSLEEEGTFFQVRSGGGTYGTWFETAEGGYNSGPWDLYFVQSIRESEGHRDHSAGRTEATYIGVGYDLTDNLWLELRGISTTGTCQDPGPDTAPPPKRETFNVDNDTLIFSINDKFEWGEGYIKGYVDRGYINWQEEDGDSNTPWQNYGIKARQTFRYEGLEVMAGLDGNFMGSEFVNTDLTGVRVGDIEWDLWHSWEPYAAVSYLIGSEDGLYAIPSYGHRWHMHSEFDDKESWQAGLVAGYGPDLQGHASFSKGYNYPGQYVRNFYQSLWTFFYDGDEYEDLEIESVEQWEVGVSAKILEKAAVNVTYFNASGEDKYAWIFPPPPPPRIVNIGEFELHGVDSSIIITPADFVSIYLGYTNIQIEEPEDEMYPRAPENTASAGLSMLLIDRLKVNVDYQYVDEQYVGNARFADDPVLIDAYNLVNAKVGWLFESGRTSGEIWVAGENLGNEEYEFLPDYPMPGPTYMGGVSLAFK